MKRLAVLALLSSCAAPAASPQPLVVTRVVTVPFVVPAALKSVPPDPAVAVWTHDSDFVKYDIRLRAVADTCRATHDALVEAASPNGK